MCAFLLALLALQYFVGVFTHQAHDSASTTAYTPPSDEALAHLAIIAKSLLVAKSVPTRREIDGVLRLAYRKIRDEAMEGIQHLELDPGVNTIAVVGDTHGDAESVSRIFRDTILNSTFMADGMVVFLGDYVDRGEHGIQTLTAILTAKVVYGSRVILIRGNHEESNINQRYGFTKQVVSAYGENYYEEFISPIFDAFPMGYVVPLLPNSTAVADRLFFAHGGIPRNGTLDAIIERCKGVKDNVRGGHNNKESKHVGTLNNCIGKDVMTDILWSDPTQKEGIGDSYTANPRGAGILYTAAFYKTFSEKNRVAAMFRGHQVVKGGFKRDFFNHYTIFSSSNYVGMGNTGSYALLDVKCMQDALTKDTKDGQQDKKQANEAGSNHIPLHHCISGRPLSDVTQQSPPSTGKNTINYNLHSDL